MAFYFWPAAIIAAKPVAVVMVVVQIGYNAKRRRPLSSVVLKNVAMSSPSLRFGLHFIFAPEQNLSATSLPINTDSKTSVLPRFVIEIENTP
jgi:hypothetical protein